MTSDGDRWVPAPLLAPSRLDALCRAASTPREAYREALQETGRALESAFETDAPIEELVHRRADTIDLILERIWGEMLGEGADVLALAAVGGYGRRELHPGSDIDILLLVAGSGGPSAHASVIESFLTFLWDIGLEVGHSVRTVGECVEQATGDISVITNLMEARLLAGRSSLFDEMREATSSRAIWPSDEFFAAKREERSARHHKFNDTAYNLEPNVKDGPGGLRDIHMIAWVLKRHYGTDRLADLITEGILSASECTELMTARDFLWRVRFGLHIITGRHEDRLLFDHQRVLAERFGYRDDGRRLAVEHFMKHYYRTIMALSRMNEMLMELFSEAILQASAPARVEQINSRFQSRNGYLEVTHDQVFERYPFALLEMFLVLQQHRELAGVRASTIRLVRDHTHLIDNDFRSDIRCRSLFLEILKQPRGLTHELRRMHRYGVLAAFIPSFGDIVGQMQHDLFHVYTVDEHTLFVVRNLRRFTVPEYYHEFPMASGIVLNLPKPELVYLAALFHDIAKGRGGDHSVLGADDARNFCLTLGMSDWDANLVAWLVRHHLVMSTTAQRQDIADPEVINRFAEMMGDRVHLNYLYLLTVADIRGTNPTLWNSWKDALLKELYQATLRALRRGQENPIGNQELAFETRDEAWDRLTMESDELHQVKSMWESLPEDYFLRHSPDEIAWHAKAILEAPADDQARVLVRPRTHRGGTEVFIYTKDRDYLFAAATTALDQLALNIVDARIITSTNGMALDTFIVLESDGKPIESRRREEEISAVLGTALASTEAAPAPVNKRLHRRLKHFPVSTRLRFGSDPTSGRTTLEVITGDKPGLLSRIAVAMTDCGVRLHGAKIATFGERAEDIFFVTDAMDRPLDSERQDCLEGSIRDAL